MAPIAWKVTAKLEGVSAASIPLNLALVLNRGTGPPIWSHRAKPRVGKKQVEKRGRVNTKEELGSTRKDTICTRRDVPQVSGTALAR